MEETDYEQQFIIDYRKWSRKTSESETQVRKL